MNILLLFTITNNKGRQHASIEIPVNVSIPSNYNSYLKPMRQRSKLNL